MRIAITALAAALVFSGCTKEEPIETHAMAAAKKFVRASIDRDPQAKRMVEMAKTSFSMDLVTPMENCMEQALFEAKVTNAELSMLESVFDGKQPHKDAKVPPSIAAAMGQFKVCLETTASAMQAGFQR